MSRNKDEEAPQVYYIPANYDDSGGVLGGRIGTRNAVELAVFCGPLVYLESKLLRFSIQTNIIIALVTILPVAFLCVFGVGGETISQLLLALIRYFRSKRVLHYDMFTQVNSDERKKFNLDKFLDIASSSGLKAAIAKAQEENSNAEASSSEEKKGPARNRPRLGEIFRKRRVSDDEEVEEIKEDLRRQEREIKGQTKGWLSAARRDKGHRSFNIPGMKK